LTLDSVVQFFPRGGSAFVVNYLTRELTARGTRATILAGSLGAPGQASHAATFYRGLPLAPAYDYTPAAEAHAAGTDSMDGQAAPFHPSYEDRGPAAPDRQATAVAPTTYTHLTRAWERHLAAHRSQRPDVLHLHHLSHLQEAAHRAYPGVPRVTTLHGTDLKLLDEAHTMRTLARRVGASVPVLAAHRASGPAGVSALLRLARDACLDEQETALLTSIDWRLWRHTDTWIASMESWSRRTGTLVTVSTADRAQAARLLRVPERDIAVVPNGADLPRFHVRHLTARQKLAHLRTWLVDDPRGWAPGRGPGTIRYTTADLQRLQLPDGHLRPLVLWIGRFQKVKRLDVLLHAFAEAARTLRPAPALLLWGGVPGECEGTHPLTLARRLGVENDVYLIGWRGHGELPLGLACADLMAAPAVGESFGMVYVEAMAAGVPPIATHTGGPRDFIHSAGPRANGWTVHPDDPDDLTATLRSALTNPAELARRARNASDVAHADYGWPTITDRYAAIYDRLRRTHR
jgi:glycosyltransferase involved in cell wall biosynthesis